MNWSGATACRCWWCQRSSLLCCMQFMRATGTLKRRRIQGPLLMMYKHSTFPMIMLGNKLRIRFMFWFWIRIRIVALFRVLLQSMVFQHDYCSCVDIIYYFCILLPHRLIPCLCHFLFGDTSPIFYFRNFHGLRGVGNWMKASTFLKGRGIFFLSMWPWAHSLRFC